MPKAIRLHQTGGPEVLRWEDVWSMFQVHTGIATDQLAISLQEIPSSNAMEMGQIMHAVTDE